MKKIMILGIILVFFLTGCDDYYKYADNWRVPRQFSIEDAYSEDPGVDNMQLSEMLKSCKSSLSKVIDRKSTKYLLWQNFNEVEILMITKDSTNNLSEGVDAYYNRDDNTIYVLTEAMNKDQSYLRGVICHELVHTLTWSEKLDSLLSEGIADLYAARALGTYGDHYEISYLNATFATLCLESCYGDNLLRLAVAGELPAEIDQDLGKVGLGYKLNESLSAVYYYSFIEPNEDNCHEALLAQFDILSHLVAKKGQGQDQLMVIDLIGSYDLSEKEQEYFVKIIKARS